MRRAIGEELRDARLAAGTSQRHVAKVAGQSQSRVSRTERASGASPRIDELATHAAAIGLKISLKAYPLASPVRDLPQLRLLERFRARLHPHYTWLAEAPIGVPGDLRAWDVRLDGPGSIGVDAETRLHDIQAIQRRTETKWRDSQVDRVILLVASTRHNRRVVTEHRETLRSTFPADNIEVLATIRAGRLPLANSILIL